MMKLFIFLLSIIFVHSADVDELTKLYENGEIDLNKFILELGPDVKSMGDFIYVKALGEFKVNESKSMKADFLYNLDKITELNGMYTSLTFGISRLTFINFDEFRHISLMIPITMVDYDKAKIRAYGENSSSIKEYVNLVEERSVGPVKDQGKFLDIY